MTKFFEKLSNDCLELLDDKEDFNTKQIQMTKFFEKLSNDCLELLDDKEDFNVIINVGESTNTKIFQTHSNILRYRSLYFRNELANVRKDKNNIKTIHLNHVSIQQFEVIVKDLNKGLILRIYIKYIYGGVVLLEKDQGASFIFELIFVASEFLLDELVNHLETQLINENSHWLRLNFAKIYHKSFQNENLRELQKWCNDILAKYPDKIFESEEFITLPENALISLIKRDDLQMDEGKIWEHVIRWGMAQNKYLPSDPKDWSRENFLALKTILQNCLPFIRYFQMSNDVIVEKVKPYKYILEESLWDDIFVKFITPNKQILSTILPPRMKPTFDPLFSKVINENHAAEIASWIDKKTEMYSAKNNPYKFKMLLRGTRDGFTAQSFWNLCDKQANTVVVMKVNGTDEILGGYNPIEWVKSVNGNYVKCNDCFIFSLKNGTIQSSILSRVSKSQSAIYCYSNYGPTFGNDLHMGDNSNQNNNCYCKHNSYEKAIRNQSGQSHFCVEEYEDTFEKDRVSVNSVSQETSRSSPEVENSIFYGKSCDQNQTTCCYLFDIVVTKKDRTCQGIKLCEFANSELQEMLHTSVDPDSDLQLKINKLSINNLENNTILSSHPHYIGNTVKQGSIIQKTCVHSHPPPPPNRVPLTI
ncbi:hypothetical protein C2G38_2221684 [Gigaspora rosea]|uniref:TLD-domain-containing protein n=1 Tax=Gigaspora rosea TaxID=44941 RepID=A0A397U4W5_9GLOM|nr:hypothetical protein C2G38_2221684 [Gigaspora rosea]